MSSLKEISFREKGGMIVFIKKLMKFALKYKKRLYGFFVFVLIVAAVDAAFPIVWMKMLDNVIVPMADTYMKQREQGTFTALDLSGVWTYSYMFLGLGLLLAFSVFMFIMFAGKIKEYVMYDIREALFNKLQSLPFSFYDKSAVGWLMSRITSDTEKVAELISWGLIEATWGMGVIVLCLIAMFSFNVKLAIIVTSTIPLLAYASKKINDVILRYSRESRRTNSEITAAFNEHINGVDVNKSTVQEERVSGEFTLLSEKMRGASYKSAFYSALFFPLIIFISSISAAAVLYVGGKMALGLPPEITIGTLAAFFGYAILMFEPVMDISRFYSQAQGCLSAGERIFTLLETESDLQDREGAGEFGRIKGDIEFDNVSFAYEENKPVLHNVNLKINSGESIALVGETGGGKSTIINLICRFYEPVQGNIKIDGIDYTENTIESLRRQIGVVLQTPHLFSGTVRENLKYANENATDEEITEALELSGAEEFITRLDEQAGEGGENFSMGQRQLLSFARAVLANPRIFIMDEATSSVDTLTEVRIQEGLTRIIEGRTSIIIAHRLSTIKNCDRILFIKRGKIIEEGSHRELMAKRGNYYHLYSGQLRREKEETSLVI